MQRICLLVPVYKPQPFWASNLLQKTREFETFCQFPIEKWVISDGKAFGHWQEGLNELEYQGWRILQTPKNQGKGAALRYAFAAVQADAYVFTDADFPYQPENAAHMVKQILSGHDLVFGKRQPDYLQALPAKRRLISAWLKWFNSNLLKLPHPDTQCGLKAFSQKGKKLLLKTKSSGFAFDLELAILANRQSTLHWSSFDVTLREELHFSDMPVKLLIREGLGLLKSLNFKK